MRRLGLRIQSGMAVGRILRFYARERKNGSLLRPRWKIFIVVGICVCLIGAALSARNFLWGDSITVTVINETKTTIEGCYVTFLSGREDVPKLAAGESYVVTVRPKAECSLDIIYTENGRRYGEATDTYIGPYMRGTILLRLKEGGRVEAVEETYIPSVWETVRPW